MSESEYLKQTLASLLAASEKIGEYRERRYFAISNPDEDQSLEAVEHIERKIESYQKERDALQDELLVLFDALLIGKGGNR